MRKIYFIVIIFYLPIIFLLGFIAVVVLGISKVFTGSYYDFTSSRAIKWIVQPLHDMDEAIEFRGDKNDNKRRSPRKD